MQSIATPLTISLGAGDFEYRVQKKNSDNTYTTIYTGKAYRRPRATYSYVVVNDICLPFLDSRTANRVEELEVYPTAVTFRIQKNSGGSWSTVGTDFTFANSWNGTTTAGWADLPQKAVLGQPLRWVFLEATDEDGCAIKSLDQNYNTVTESRIVPESPGIFTMEFPDNTNPGAVYYAFELQTENIKILTIDRCSRYGISFLNASGQYDYFVPQFNAKTEKTVERQTITTQMTKRNLRNVIGKTYTFQSGFLTDAQSKAFGQMIDSPYILLFDAQTNEEVEVICTVTGYEEKTYHVGARLVNYEFQLEVAKQEERR